MARDGRYASTVSSAARWRSVSSSQKLEYAFTLSDSHRREWLLGLRRRYPTLSEEEMRLVVIAERLKESDEERQIAQGIFRVNAARRSGDSTFERAVVIQSIDHVNLVVHHLDRMADFDLSDKQREVRRAVREFARWRLERTYFDYPVELKVLSALSALR